MLRGISSQAKTEWIEQICLHKGKIIEKGMPDRLRLLESISQNISGIGPKSVWETLLWFEEQYSYR